MSDRNLFEVLAAVGAVDILPAATIPTGRSDTKGAQVPAVLALSDTLSDTPAGRTLSPQLERLKGTVPRLVSARRHRSQCTNGGVGDRLNGSNPDLPSRTSAVPGDADFGITVHFPGWVATELCCLLSTWS